MKIKYIAAVCENVYPHISRLLKFLPQIIIISYPLLYVCHWVLQIYKYIFFYFTTQYLIFLKVQEVFSIF